MYSKLTAALLLLLATSAGAQHGHRGAGETGQSQFAAIAEIVTLLRGDANTDWRKVSIDGLRAHLVDMDNVTMGTFVDMQIDGKTVAFRVTGDAKSALSAQRMVVAHAPMLRSETGWNVAVRVVPDGVDMIVTAHDPKEVSQIKALGFYGLMTIGAHHQQHHLMLARGHDPH